MSQPHKSKMTHIAIFGAGLSGRAAYQRAQNLGIRCVIDDDVMTEHEAIAAQDFIKWQNWDFSKYDALILSPGIAHNHPNPHPVAQAARKAEVEIISEVEFGLRTGNWGKFVVITGTNGKSTTTALTAHLLKTGGAKVAVGGNLGTPLCALNEAEKDGITVVELSSYQLETTPSLAPDIAALLNITPDHLDRHGGLEGYIAAKMKSLSACHKDSLALIGDEGAIMQRVLDDARQKLTCTITAISAHSLGERVLDNPTLAGAHNAQNAAFAVAIAKTCGCDDDTINAGLASFEGLAHRLQPVGMMGAMRFVNDSKATNGDASAKALGAYQNIMWLAGGRAKADGLTACLPYFNHIARAYFYGECAGAFFAEAQAHIPCSVHETLDEAFAQAMTDASDTSVILLSPAAASFDQFPNFGTRGAHFTQLANRYITAQTREVSHVG